MVHNMTRLGATKAWMVLAVLGAVLAAILWLRPLEVRRDIGSTHPSVGRKLPDLELIPLTGASSSVTTEQLAGKVVLLNFWGTWCQPCQVEFPHLARLAANYRDRPDFQLLSVSCGGGAGEYEDVEALRRQTDDFLAAFQSTLPTWCDPDHSARSALAETIEFSGYPMTFAIDRQGVVRAVWAGYRPGMEENVESVVASLLVAR
jgi:thiol-disulfide isomerase/thioredoxin